MKKTLLFSVGLLSLALTGCVRHAAVSYDDAPRHYAGGPPPHAPAHGYRYKYQQHQMIYDSRLRAYVVLGYDDYYYSGRRYFRYRERDWQFSRKLDGKDWRHADYYKVPEGLRDRYRPKKRPHPGKGNDKDKYRR